MIKRFDAGRIRPMRAIAVLAAMLAQAYAVHGGAAVSQESAASTFGIPLKPWTVEAVVGLRTEFVEGVAGQVLAVAEGQAADEVRDITATAEELAQVSARIRSTMTRIGTLDTSFGISGISRLATAGNAQRDTLFGLVVWHESAAGESRKIAADLEGTVVLMNDLAARAERHAEGVAQGADLSRSALGQGEFAHLESSSSAVVEATAGLIEDSDRIQEAATKLEETVWTIRGDEQTALDAEWQKVLLSVSEVRRLAAKFRPAVETFESSNHVFRRITDALSGVVETTSMIEAGRSNPHGVYRIEKDALARDVEIARELEATALSESHNGSVYPEQTKAAIRSLLVKLLTADGILAERAVEHASTEVSRAQDALEKHYEAVVGYDENDPERRRNEALTKIDLAIRSNEEMDRARVLARGARAALDAGTADQGRGAGSETEALTRYVSAWSQSLEAGASAERALGAVKPG